MPRPQADKRSFKIELRSIETDGQRRIVGHAAVFNSLSEEMCGFREIIKPGAFATAIQNSDVRALWNHNPDYVLGRTKANTLSITEDERGLAVTIIPPDTQFARDLMVSMDRGDIDQMSFAFTVKNDRWYTNTDGLTIREIVEVDELFDVSPVTYPAYTDTDVSARTKEALAEYRSTQSAVGAGGSGDKDEAEKRAAERERLLQIAAI